VNIEGIMGSSREGTSRVQSCATRQIAPRKRSRALLARDLVGRPELGVGFLLDTKGSGQLVDHVLIRSRLATAYRLFA
jgi:hypothetical protein